jgi:hypothetical protein
MLVMAFASGADAATRPTATVIGGSGKTITYKKTFPVSSCTSTSTKDVTLVAASDGYTLTIKVKKLPGALRVRGGGGEEAVTSRTRSPRARGRDRVPRGR